MRVVVFQSVVTQSQRVQKQKQKQFFFKNLFVLTVENEKVDVKRGLRGQ
jgi:hypothetical protein